MDRQRLTEKSKRICQAGDNPPLLACPHEREQVLLPCPEESRGWDITKNLYFEGDNLMVLRLLESSHAGTIDMIYIDPPYNTGRTLFTTIAFPSRMNGTR